MGDPKKIRKTYTTPAHPWRAQIMAAEEKLLKQYGLKSKTELWKVEAVLRKYRRIAKQLSGVETEESEKKKIILINKLARFGLLQKNATLEDVLALETSDFLERRIQTIVFKKGFANTILEARKHVTNGHIKYGSRKHTAPGTLIPIEEDSSIIYAGPKKVAPPAVPKAAEAEPKPKQHPVNAAKPNAIEVE